MAIKIIAALDSNSGIGYKNDLLFKIPKDLKRFKELTEGHFIIMGRKTFDSLPKQLPHRINVILTRDKKKAYPSDVFVMDSIEHIVNHYRTGKQDKDIWVIGGETIYRQFLPFADEMYLTHVDKKVKNVDTFFPLEESKEYFRLIEKETNYSVDEDCYYNFSKYVKIKSTEEEASLE